MTFKQNFSPSRRALVLGLLAVSLPRHPVLAAPLARRFSPHAKTGSLPVDHSAFDALLKTYVARAPDGINKVRYKAFRGAGHRALQDYLAMLSSLSPRRLDRAGQFAFWVNLYNAKTLDIVLSHYPVSSIRDINLGSGFLSRGPWKKKLLEVDNTPLSLDDIEHQILRPIWRDNRVHYALNCASIGCPELARRAYRARLLSSQLNHAASAYINHPRAVRVKDGQITASRIYDWYGVDFGGRRGLIPHWRKYANNSLRRALARAPKIAGFAYDWRLNAF